MMKNYEELETSGAKVEVFEEDYPTPAPTEEKRVIGGCILVSENHASIRM